MKTKKKKPISSYQKAVQRMELEMKRSLSHVMMLEKMYNEMKNKENKDVRTRLD
jgi:hypothetical protein